MALRAGYVGVKRWLYERLQKNMASVKDQLVTIYGNNVKNLYACEATSGSDTHGLTWTVDANDKNLITVSGTPDGFTAFYTVSHNMLKPGKYILTGTEGVTNAGFNSFELRSGSTLVRNIPVSAAGPALIEIKATDIYDNIRISLKRLTNGTACSGAFKLMLRPADVEDATYVPFAKTNYQLTGDITTLEDVDDAHKTVINGIISAATGAADFAAFKTAMGALTPLTRSAAPDNDTRTLEEVEDPAPVTKSTRSKKTVKEEE